VTTKVGDAAEEGEWKESAGRSIGRIRELADYAATLRMKLSLEMPHPGTLTETLEQSLAFIERTNHTAMDITLDSSHVYATGADIREVSRHFIGKLGHVHLRDANQDETHLVPGDGEINFEFFYDMMVLAGFHRDYVVEIKFDEDKSLDDIKGELERGMEEILPALKMVKKKKKPVKK
jgi:sugar phosphate isomerase/epimerase